VVPAADLVHDADIGVSFRFRHPNPARRHEGFHAVTTVPSASSGPNEPAGPNEAPDETAGPVETAGSSQTAGQDRALDEPALRARVREFLAAHPPSETEPAEFLRARFDAGLAWVHYPPGLGGLGAARALQPAVEAEFAAAGAPRNQPERNGIGLGMAAPTILTYGTEQQRHRFLRPLWTGEEIWCQLFSEPGAGSDLAALATRAVRDRGGDWVVNGQKVWTSMAHQARWAIMVARTDPDVPKHQGMTYFICDMTAPGVEVRPLRQLTGEAEFNEVFFTDVRIPDDQRLGAVGEGWRVAQTTLNNERVAIGGAAVPREGSAIGVLTRAWRERPELRRPGLHDAMLRLWVDAEVARLTGLRLRQLLAAGHPGPEGAAIKLTFARINQEVSGLEMELLGEDALRYDDWAMRRPSRVDFTGRGAGYRYLRAKGNSIEGGTSEILRNVIAERVLGLPREIRTDTNVAWKDLPR
jgi:alkylation response protein AidB-like acyl-CoA dehydrogenase